LGDGENVILCLNRFVTSEVCDLPSREAIKSNLVKAQDQLLLLGHLATR